MTKNYVFGFDEANPCDNDLLGGKGAGLARMVEMGLAVPPGFTITTAACRYYLDEGRVPPKLWSQVEAALARIENQTGRRLGGLGGPPLLLSARSGAKISMPGMMSHRTQPGGQPCCGLGTHDVVRRCALRLGRLPAVDPDLRGRGAGSGERRFRRRDDRLRDRRNVTEDSRLPTSDLVEAVRSFRMILAAQRREVPSDPMEQLRTSIRAVFESWNAPRAYSYRRLNGIAHDLGTACNIQMMVFGNLGTHSGTGVYFTRDPATGHKEMFGDYLANAQERGRGGGDSPDITDRLPGRSPPRGPRGTQGGRGRLGVRLRGHVRHRVHDRERETVDLADACR